jgi:hypothetical protein
MSLNTGDQEYNSGKKYRQKGTLCGPNICPHEMSEHHGGGGSGK